MVDHLKVKINVSADLLRRAALAKSDDEWRFYLGGVYVEPAKAGGVLLVATDGHILACLHDKDGSASHPTIINPNKDMLAWAKRSNGRRFLKFGQARILMRDGELIGAFANNISKDGSVESSLIEARQWRDAWIDGNFPDYRRAIPKDSDVNPIMSGVSAPLIAKAHAILGDKVHCCMSFRAEKNDGISPMVARIDNDDVAGFCIIMPMRGWAMGYPDFWKAETAPTPAR